jgi:hypothetical protein
VTQCVRTNIVQSAVSLFTPVPVSVVNTKAKDRSCLFGDWRASNGGNCNLVTGKALRLANLKAEAFLNCSPLVFCSALEQRIVRVLLFVPAPVATIAQSLQ